VTEHAGPPRLESAYGRLMPVTAFLQAILSAMPLVAKTNTHEYARLVAGARGLFGAEERVSGLGPAREHERVQRLCRLPQVVGQ
jgi:hypothetical protein